MGDGGTEEREEVGTGEDGSEVETETDAEGKGGGDEGYAEGGAFFEGERGGEEDGVVREGDAVLLVGGFAEVAVVGGDCEDLWVLVGLLGEV